MKAGLACSLIVLVACDEAKKTAAPSASASASASASMSASVAAPASLAVSASAPPLSSAPSGAASTTAPENIAAQHVLVAYKGAKNAPTTVRRSKSDAKKLADEVLAKARGGTDFSALVAEYSEDPGTKDRQGSLGRFNRKKMVKPFADAAFALAVDEVSPIVETEFGFHIIKRNQ